MTWPPKPLSSSCFFLGGLKKNTTPVTSRWVWWVESLLWECPPAIPWRELAATLAALPEIVAVGKDVELATWPAPPAPMDSMSLHPIMIRSLNNGQLNSDPFNLRAEEMAMQDCVILFPLAFYGYLGELYTDITEGFTGFLFRVFPGWWVLVMGPDLSDLYLYNYSQYISRDHELPLWCLETREIEILWSYFMSIQSNVEGRWKRSPFSMFLLNKHI